MSEDKIVKNANEIIYNAECWIDDEEYTGAEEKEWAEFEKNTVKGLLDLYNKEKEKNKELYKDNQKQWGERCRLAIELDNNTISKDKIKAKIEEYEQLSERNKDGKHWTDEAILYDRQAEALRELLED